MSTTIFQFHKGAIRTTNMGIVEYRCANFNSIKVRLEQGGGRSPHRTNNLFQFHKGAIRTSYKMQRWLNGRIFQFHKGAIRTYIFFQKLGEFNIFQFHKGAIRTTLMPPFLGRE